MTIRSHDGVAFRAAAPAGPVAVFDAGSPPAIAFTRSLGRAGVPVVVCSESRWPAARFSRYASEFRRCPDKADPSAFLPWLHEELRRGRIGLIAPTSDGIAFALAELFDHLPEAARRASPSPEAMLDALFKDRFDAACARHGMKTPWSFAPATVEEARDRAASYPYPVILKPKSHVGAGLLRGRIARDADDLRRHYGSYPIEPGTRAIIERYPSLALPMIQEVVPDALQNLFSVSGFLDPGGRLIACSASRKRAQWPPDLGVGTLFESCFDEEVIQRGARLAQDIVERGLFEVELIRDSRSGELFAIDLNPRAFGQISLDIARGNDLPLLFYRAAAGEELVPAPLPSEPVSWIHSIPYGIGQAVALARGPRRGERARRLLRRAGETRVDIAVDPADPFSSLVFAARSLRHPGGLIRPFFDVSADSIP